MYLRKSYSFLARYLKAHRWEMVAGALAMIAADFCVLLSPSLQAKAIRVIEHREPLNRVLWYAVGVFAVILVAGVFRYLWRVWFINASMKMGYEIRRDFFHKVLSFSPEVFARYSTGDFMARATNDMRALRMALGPGLVFSLDILVLGLVSAVMLIVKDWKLALMGLTPLPFIAMVVTYFDRKIHRKFEEVQETFSQLSERVRENIAGIRVVKSYGIESAILGRLQETSREFVRLNMQLFNIEGVFRPSIIFFSTISIIIIMVVGLEKVLHGAMDLGNYWAFNAYLMLMVWPMIGIGWIVGLLQRGTASLSRITEIMALEPEVRDSDEAVSLGKVKGEILFDGVSFSYPDSDRPVLKDMRLHIRAGEKIGFVGRVGSGKSTLFQLLLRLYRPQSGQILLDGRDIATIRLADLRRAFGVIPQETFLFSDTVRSNIAFGAPEASTEAIMRAAEQAQLQKMIQSLPEGLETEIGERGIMLSGGQKQRTAIARAVLVKPVIYIFDDAFSNLDSRTEEYLLQSLESQWKNHTVLIASQRLATLQRCHRIVVLEEGRISAVGTHEKLLACGGLYADLATQQGFLAG